MSTLTAREVISVQTPRPEPIRRVDLVLPDTISRKGIAPTVQQKRTISPVIPKVITANAKPVLRPVVHKPVIKTERPVIIPKQQAPTLNTKRRLPFLGILRVVASIKQTLSEIQEIPLMQNLEEGLAKPLVYIGIGILVLFAGVFVPIDWIKVLAFFAGLILLGLGIYYLILFLQDQ